MLAVQLEKMKILKPEKDVRKMEQGTISIEKLESGAAAVYFVIFRSKIGKALYQGAISGQFSKWKSIEEKANRVQMKISLVFRPENKEEKNRVQHLKLSFGKAEDRPKFEEAFKKVVEELKGK